MKCHKRASLNKRSESLMEKIKHEIKTEIEKQDKRDGNPFEIGSTLGGETEVYDFAIKDDLDAFKKDIGELGYEVVSTNAGVATVQKKRVEEASLKVKADKKPFQLIYSDNGAKSKRDFKDKKSAIAFAQEKGITDWNLFKNDPKFHSTTQEEHLEAFGIDANYWMAQAYKNPELRKKIVPQESKTHEHYFSDEGNKYEPVYFDDDFNLIEAGVKASKEIKAEGKSWEGTVAELPENVYSVLNETYSKAMVNEAPVKFEFASDGAINFYLAHFNVKDGNMVEGFQPLELMYAIESGEAIFDEVKALIEGKTAEASKKTAERGSGKLSPEDRKAADDRMKSEQDAYKQKGEEQDKAKAEKEDAEAQTAEFKWSKYVAFEMSGNNGNYPKKIWDTVDKEWVSSPDELLSEIISNIPMAENEEASWGVFWEGVGNFGDMASMTLDYSPDKVTDEEITAAQDYLDDFDNKILVYSTLTDTMKKIVDAQIGKGTGGDDGEKNAKRKDTTKIAEEKPEEQVFNSPEEATTYINDKRKSTAMPPDKVYETKKDENGKFKLVPKVAGLPSSSDSGAKIDLYIVKLKHDHGTTSITTSATSPEQAKKQVCDAEGVPESAVIEVKNLKRKASVQKKAGEASDESIYKEFMARWNRGVEQNLDRELNYQNASTEVAVVFNADNKRIRQILKDNNFDINQGYNRSAVKKAEGERPVGDSHDPTEPEVEEVQEEEFTEPQAGDYIMSDSGALGSRTSVGIFEGGSKSFLGEFKSEEAAMYAIKKDMDAHNFWPNIWYLDDHGGVTIRTASGKLSSEKGNSEELSTENQQIDEDAATELYIYATNDADLYRQMLQPIQKNLINKKASGIYNPTLALKAFMNFMQFAAQKYTKEYAGAGDKWFDLFPVEVRKAAASEALAYFETESGLGEYDNYLHLRRLSRMPKRI
jgi:hypothetical protein